MLWREEGGGTAILENHKFLIFHSELDYDDVPRHLDQGLEIENLFIPYWWISTDA